MIRALLAISGFSLLRGVFSHHKKGMERKGKERKAKQSKGKQRKGKQRNFIYVSSRSSAGALIGDTAIGTKGSNFKCVKGTLNNMKSFGGNFGTCNCSDGIYGGSKMWRVSQLGDEAPT